MAIQYDSSKRIFSLHTRHSTYQMQADVHDRLLHLYYGRRAEGAMDYVLTFRDRGFCPNPGDVGADRTYSLDCLPQEYPSQGTGDFRSTALMLETEDGRIGCDLRYVSHRICEGKYDLPGLPTVYAGQEKAQTLVITLEDPAVPVRVELFYGVLPDSDILTRSARITNLGEKTLYLNRALSVNLDFVTGDRDLISFYGYQGLERSFQRNPITHTEQTLMSRRGTSSHQFNPLCILADPDTTETAGSCIAVQMLYSGGNMAVAAMDPFQSTRFQMGVADYAFRYPLEKEASFTAPEAILCYSGDGLGELSIRLADCIRGHVMRGPYQNKVTPILLNSWEGCYFDFDGEKLLNLAGEAKNLGIDLLVVDDGWFGKRDDDNSGLGDWYVNEKKLGMSLAELAEKVRGMGLSFGIWVEPEMISEDSDLYRAHPDYALQIPGRKPVRGRNQLVLDFSRREVVDNIFDQITKTLDTCTPDYLKWDCNRSISDVYSCAAKEQGSVLYDYVLGLYDLLDRIGRRYPKMLIESCSGGGGRFDAGMMAYSRQIWCSDNTDAVDRLRIQYGTSFGYPNEAMGAHVSKVPNEQSGRITPLATRGIVAMAGTFGYELDPAKLGEDEKEEIRAQIRERRRIQDLIFFGDYRRLSSPYTDPVTAWSYTAKDKSAFVLSAVRTELHFGDEPTKFIRLAGLPEEACYRREEDGRVFSGAALMEVGIPLPHEGGDYRAYEWHFTRTDNN